MAVNPGRQGFLGSLNLEQQYPIDESLYSGQVRDEEHATVKIQMPICPGLHSERRVSDLSDCVREEGNYLIGSFNRDEF